MTTSTELIEITTGGENSGMEFKRDDLNPQDLAKELVAFSNLQGGMVLIGVEDDGPISGLTRENIEEWVMSVCRDKIRPPIVPFFEVVPGHDGNKKVAIVRVSRGYAVHSLWHNTSNHYFIRIGSQSCEASPDELSRLFQQRGSLRTEMSPVSGACFEDLDRRRLMNYFRDIRQQDFPRGRDSYAWKTLLTNTGIMTSEGMSVGGLLLFGKNPNKFLPHAGIDAVAYQGTEPEYDAQERSRLRGAMVPLLNEDQEFVENGLVEQALYFVQRNTRVTVESNGGRRVERPLYPRDTLREVFVNALIHRDYLLTATDIQLSVFRDRLEVTSPGRLPNGVTLEHMRVGTRSTRNELLKNVMRDYRYLEHMGMGIPRKIIKGMRDHNGTEPDLIVNGERFTVRLHT